MSVSIKEPAASYLYRQIAGGVRRTGEDGGSGRHDLFTYAIKPDRYGGVPPYRETQSYVTRINKMAGRQAAPRDKTIFKGTDVTNDGRAIPSYSNTRH